MNYTHFVSVAGLVINDSGEILLVKSPRRGWEYPGGLVEPGETLQDALIREIKEESGIDVKITGFIGLCKNIEKDIVNIDFCCKAVGGKLTTSDESTEVMWVNKEKALEMITFPLTRKRLEEMLSGSEQVSCFCFKKEPFEIVSEDYYSVGNR
ncbi:MAG: NUDIX domain-containing protein [Oscillospiraceae bacterium]|nr:NUDIX domain-containing protein [Oscillospiraceae bacterium]